MTDDLVDLAKSSAAEASFRKQLASYIGGLLKGPDVPIALKALTVVILAICILYSFEFCILVVHVVAAARHWVDKVEPMKYVYVFGAEGFSGALLAIPCVARAQSYGEAKRLEANLLPLAKAKGPRQRQRSSGATATSSSI